MIKQNISFKHKQHFLAIKEWHKQTKFISTQTQTLKLNQTMELKSAVN